MKHTFFRDFLALIFPATCLCCRRALSRSEPVVCTTCYYELPRIKNLRLPADKLKGLTGIPAVYGYLQFTKGGRVQKVIHGIKYRGETEAALFMGEQFGRKLREQVAPDVLVPVPLHGSKKMKRGYNQSKLIADGMARSLQVPVHEKVLVREKATATQTRKKRYDRWEALEGVFKGVRTKDIVGRHVLLVDDVMTTGATVETCARALQQAGAGSVRVAVLAVAV